MSKYNKDFIQYSEKKVKDEKHSLAFYLSTRISFYIVLLFFAIFFIWYTAFISTHSFYAVMGVSMMPTLNNQVTSQQLESGENLQKISYDGVYVDKTSSADVFDIVVIDKNNSSSVIKRVMAKEGDLVTIAKAQTSDGEHFYFHRIDANVLVDGKVPEDFTDEMARLDENGENGYQIYSHADWDKKLSTEVKTEFGGNFVYEESFYETFLEDFFLDPSQNLGDFHVSNQGLVYVKVPKGKFFYLGDNRAHSTDAREHGFADVKDIVGRSEFVVHDYNLGNRILQVIKYYFSQVQKFFVR